MIRAQTGRIFDIPKQLRQEIDVVFIDRVTDVLRRALLPGAEITGTPYAPEISTKLH